ncbi:serine/threonine-protein kinase [Aureliella helgolandensis]|uniref:non-specific serine/threonine protein kinase n=1 Tax=Aureliella helgolandensis TaxID=2527968 RepID=A0A518G638_9BACT|nr:serine/threonine-protein kinase [Aureliella helgolandensis]QDV24052.1 Serine/threonine-protein kinase PknB [Aureliella helgolandensis]
MSNDHPRQSRAAHCLSQEQLLDVLLPLAPYDQRVDAHLSACTACCDRLSEIAGDQAWWSAAETYLSVAAEPAAARVAQSVCALISEPGKSDERDPLGQHELSQLKSLLDPPSHPELLGRIGRYELEQLVGRGGMGLVFRGRDTELHRVVAVKLIASHLRPLGAARERFIREARACASLAHPHIVAIHDVITDSALPAIVMQYVAGPTLEAWLKERGSLSWQQVLQIATQLTDALVVAHQHGLVHRDIKPGNVLLEADGSRALLTDFGLVRALDEATLTHTGALAGTPDFMSPEQARGKSVDGRSDLFSLGALMYVMLTGHPPFRAPEPLAILHRICNEPHRSIAQYRDDVPAEVARLVDRLLNKEPKRRFAGAEELRERLLQLSRSSLHLSHRRKRRLPWLVGALSLVAVLGFASWSTLARWIPGGGSTSSWYSTDAPHNPAWFGNSDHEQGADYAGSLNDLNRNATSKTNFQVLQELDTSIAKIKEQTSRLVQRYSSAGAPGSTSENWNAVPRFETDMAALQQAVGRLRLEMRQE